MAVVLSLATFFSTALGGLFALHQRGRLYLVMAFSSGLLIAAALLDLLPDALELMEQTGRGSAREVFAAAVAGYLVFYGLDRFVHSLAAAHVDEPEDHHDHHGHHQHHRHQAGAGVAPFGMVAALGLVVHSFLDGVAIGSGFRVDTGIGILVALAVIGHDFGDGVSTVSVVLGSRGGLRASIGWLLADAIAPVLGSATTLTLALSPRMLADLLGFFAGSFLFIGASHLLPESQQEGTVWGVALTVLSGMLLIAFVTQLL